MSRRFGGISPSSLERSAARNWCTSITPPLRKSHELLSKPSPAITSRGMPMSTAACILSEHATGEHERARRRVQRFINAPHASEIIFVRGATEAINLVAQTYGRVQVRAGDEVLITAMEHHSNIVPWQIMCEEKGAKLRVAPINDDGEVLLDEFEKLLGPRTRIVAVAHVSNALGTVNPVRE